MIKITKDEARILSVALEAEKFRIAEMFHSKQEANEVYTALNHLQETLLAFCKDRRRFGRKSQDDYFDCIRRYKITKKIS